MNFNKIKFKFVILLSEYYISKYCNCNNENPCYIIKTNIKLFETHILYSTKIFLFPIISNKLR